jgi:hypothetical protein
MGLLRGMARTAVVAGTATSVSNRVSRRQAQRWDAQDNAANSQAAPAAPSYNNDDQIRQLEKLGELHERGILTDEEFDDQKRQVLGY